MVNQCKNCGGQLHYDIASRQLVCAHCSSTFDPVSFESRTNAQESSQAADAYAAAPFSLDMTIYTCPTCGAQISSVENAAIDYCMYCGSFVTLGSEMAKVRRPDYIIPFSKTAEECRTSYKKMMHKKIYAPKIFRDDTFLEGFKGIYIPFWTYEYTYGPSLTIPGEHSSQHGDYIHKQAYEITCDVDNAIKEAAFDASSSFDDALSKNLVPFDYRSREQFNASYMFGFYGDTADVPESIYAEESRNTVRDEIWSDISSAPAFSKGYPDRPSDGLLDSRLDLKGNATLTMLPVWFLTWKNGNRVAYSVVNGDTGTIYSESPVSVMRYLLISLLTAVPLFLLLNSFFTFTASGMLTFSLVLSAFTILIYALQMEAIVKRTLHADDKGYLAIYQNGNAPNMKENLFLDLLRTVSGAVSGSVTEILIALAILLIAGLVLFFEFSIIAVILIALVLPVYTFWCIYRQGKLLGNRAAVADTLGAYAAFIISGIILIMDPAADIIYYMAAIGCMLAIGFTAIRIIFRYNEMATRPMPHFFDRKAGDDK